MSKRERARALAAGALAAGEPTAWFETLYREAAEGSAVVPWADLVPNPELVDWLDSQHAAPVGRALDVGCGYGDNAAELARRGFDVQAFDVSESAVARATERFGEQVQFRTADAGRTPSAWAGAFDLVTEIYTLQVLPPPLRAKVAAHLGSLLKPGGTLLIICRGRDDTSEPPAGLPWPLTRQEIHAFGREVERFEDFMDGDDPPVRRFRVTLKRSLESSAPSSDRETRT